MSCCTRRRGKESRSRRGEFKDAERRRFNQLKDLELVRIHRDKNGYYSPPDKPPIVHLGTVKKQQVTTCVDNDIDQRSIHPQVDTACVTSSKRRDSLYSTCKGLTALPGSEFYQLGNVLSPNSKEYVRMKGRASSNSGQTSIRDQNPINNCDALGIHYPPSDRPQLPPFPWELPQQPPRAALRDSRSSEDFGGSGCTDNLFSRIPPKPGYRDLNSNPLPSRRRAPAVPARTSSLRSDRSMSSRDRRPMLSYRESQEFLRPRPAPPVPGSAPHRPSREPLRVNTSIHNEGPNPSRETQQRPLQAFLSENQRPPPPPPPPPPRMSPSRNDGPLNTRGTRAPIDLTPHRPPPPPPIRRRPVGAPPLDRRTIRLVPTSPSARIPGTQEVEEVRRPHQDGSSREARQIVPRPQSPQGLTEDELQTLQTVAGWNRPSRCRERLDSNGISPCSPQGPGGGESWRRQEVSPLSPVVLPGDGSSRRGDGC